MITNYDDICGAHVSPPKHHEQMKWYDKLPACHTLVIGATLCGKTNYVLSILMKELVNYDKLYIFVLFVKQI